MVAVVHVSMYTTMFTWCPYVYVFLWSVLSHCGRCDRVLGKGGWPVLTRAMAMDLTDQINHDQWRCGDEVTCTTCIQVLQLL